MAKQTLTQYLYMRHEYTPDYSDKVWVPQIYPFVIDDQADRIFLQSVEVTVDVPDNFDPTAKQVAAMQAEREKVVAEFATKLRRIDDQIAQLQALTNEVAA